MIVTQIGTNPDGSPYLHYQQEDPASHVVQTGPIQGIVRCGDGTSYDVRPEFIEVAAGHSDEVAHLIALRYVNEGHPTDPNFTYEPSEG